MSDASGIPRRSGRFLLTEKSGSASAQSQDVAMDDVSGMPRRSGRLLNEVSRHEQPGKKNNSRKRGRSKSGDTRRHPILIDIIKGFPRNEQPSLRKRMREDSLLPDIVLRHRGYMEATPVDEDRDVLVRSQLFPKKIILTLLSQLGKYCSFSFTVSSYLDSDACNVNMPNGGSLVEQDVFSWSRVKTVTPVFKRSVGKSLCDVCTCSIQAQLNLSQELHTTSRRSINLTPDFDQMIQGARPPRSHKGTVHSETFWGGLEVSTLGPQRWNSPEIYKGGISEKFSKASYVVPPLRPMVQALPGVTGVDLNEISRFIGADVPLPCFGNSLLCNSPSFD